MVIGVVSANRQQEVVDRSLAAGAMFLPKPITEAALGPFLKAAAHEMGTRP